MKKIILGLVIFSLVSGISANVILAQETATAPTEETTTTTISSTEDITATTEQGGRPRLLPTSHFYFLKEWWRGLKIGFTKDPIKKSEIQLQVLTEKMAEADEIAKKTPKAEILEKAFDNYTNTLDKLKTRLEELKETSENPNIDKLLDRIAEAEVRHQETLDRILEKVPKAAIYTERVRKQINQSLPLLRLRFENQKEFIDRLENKLQELNISHPAPVGEFKQLRITENMEKQLNEADLKDYPAHVQAKAEQLKEVLEKRIQQRVQTLEKQGFSSSTIEQVINFLPEPSPKIPPEKLPQTPPPGRATTTDNR